MLLFKFQRQCCAITWQISDFMTNDRSGWYLPELDFFSVALLEDFRGPGPTCRSFAPILDFQSFAPIFDFFHVGGSGVGDGNVGSTSASQKFWFVPIQAKFLKIWKMASNVFKFKKWRPTTHEDLVLEVIQKNVFVGENWKFAGKSWKIFSGKSGENRAKILCTPKNLPAFTTLVGAYCLAQQCLVRYLLHSDGGLDPDGIPLPQIACRLPICWWHDACLSAPKTLFDLKSPKDFGKK